MSRRTRSAQPNNTRSNSVDDEYRLALGKARKSDPSGFFLPGDILENARCESPQLYKVLRSRGDELTTSEAADALGSVIGDPAENGAARLAAIKLIGRASEMFLGAWVFTAGLHLSERNRLLDGLVLVFREPHQDLTNAAIETIRRFRDNISSSTVRALAIKLRGEGNPAVVLAILGVLEGVGCDLLANAVNEIGTLTEHADEAIGRTACRLIAQLGDASIPLIRPLMRAALGSGTPERRTEAMSAILMLSPAFDDFIGLVDQYGARDVAFQMLAEMGDRGREYRRRIGLITSAAPGKAVSAKRRAGSYCRDHIWLKWATDEGLHPAAIRDKWNGMTDAKRRQLVPFGDAEKIAIKGAGQSVVKQGLKKAREERS